MSRVTYYIDGANFKDYNVFVSASEGLLSLPKSKKPLSLNWETEHGEVVDLSKRYYEARTIRLDCFITAENEADFIMYCKTFVELFQKPGTRRLSLTVDASEPLVYEVYIEEEVDFKKKWRPSTMAGTFTLTLKEPEPVKKVIKYTRTSESNKTVSITVTSTKRLSFYWGEGSHTFDVSGTSQTVTKSYSVNGTYYIIVTGDIDSITSLTTTGVIVWQKL